MIFRFLSLLDIQGNRVGTPNVVHDLGIDVETDYLFIQLILCFHTCRTSQPAFLFYKLSLIRNIEVGTNKICPLVTAF